MFAHLDENHNSDADDVAVAYLRAIDASPQRDLVVGALRQHRPLIQLLIKVLDEGVTGPEEARSIERLRAL